MLRLATPLAARVTRRHLTPHASSDPLKFARRARAHGVARIADEFEPLAGGTMCFGGFGS